MKPLKFETSEEFASTTKEFVSLLQTLTQAVTGVTQHTMTCSKLIWLIEHPLSSKVLYIAYSVVLSQKKLFGEEGILVNMQLRISIK